MLRVAHDIRQFITVILGNADLARRHCNCGASKHLDNILEAANTMEHLLQDALTRSRLSTNDRPDLNKVCAAVAELLEDDADMIQMKLVTDPAVRLLRKEDSAIGVYRAILNLCANARHAIKRTRCGVFSDNAADGLPRPSYVGMITVGTIARDENAIVYVSDTGEGMGAEAVQKLIGRMTGGENEIHEGHGYGLQIVNAMVKRVGGTIDVKSTLGVGTVFTITIPAQDITHAAPAPVPRSSARIDPSATPPGF